MSEATQEGGRCLTPIAATLLNRWEHQQPAFDSHLPLELLREGKLTFSRHIGKMWAVPVTGESGLGIECLMYNRTISDTAPATYMAKMDEALKSSIAASSLLPLDAMDGSKPYADFISRRAEILAEAASKLVETAEI
jgi:hypothetical protein